MIGTEFQWDFGVRYLDEVYVNGTVLALELVIKGVFIHIFCSKYSPCPLGRAIYNTPAPRCLYTANCTLYDTNVDEDGCLLHFRVLNHLDSCIARVEKLAWLNACEPIDFWYSEVGTGRWESGKFKLDDVSKSSIQYLKGGLILFIRVDGISVCK
jgi:hypothetical protein